jgi:3-hydroxyisobutyrate dehydrogenase-like beta-hydroxyacid dehydrogenase
MRSRLKLGFIGLGEMGALIVPRLMAAGHEVTGWNRTKAKGEALLASGMKWAYSPPGAAAADADVVFSIETDGAAVRTVAFGPSGILAA